MRQNTSMQTEKTAKKWLGNIKSYERLHAASVELPINTF